MCSRQFVPSDVELSVSTANRHFPESQMHLGKVLYWLEILFQKSETEYFVWKWRGRQRMVL